MSWHAVMVSTGGRPHHRLLPTEPPTRRLLCPAAPLSGGIHGEEERGRAPYP